MINSKAVKGEEGTGFEERGELGLFECGNCEYFNGSDVCNQEDMMKVSKRARHEDGTVVVGPLDCCEYVDRTGKIQSDRSYLVRLTQIVKDIL